MRAAPDCALDDEIVTIRPQPAASMSGIAACTQWNVPVRLTASIRSHASSGDVGERLELVDAGARDHDLDRPELAAHLRQRVVDRGAVGDVDLAATARRAGLAQFVGGPRHGVAVEVEQRDLMSRPPRGAGRSARPMPDAAPVTTATRVMRSSSGCASGEYCASPNVRKLTLEKRECHCHRARPR